MKFQAIMSGHFGVISINARLRQICEAITRLEELQGVAQVAPETTTVTAPAKLDLPVQEAKEEAAALSFAWRESKSVGELKAFARQEFGLSIRKKLPETIKAEIQSYIDAQE